MDAKSKMRSAVCGGYAPEGVLFRLAENACVLFAERVCKTLKKKSRSGVSLRSRSTIQSHLCRRKPVGGALDLEAPHTDATDTCVHSISCPPGTPGSAVQRQPGLVRTTMYPLLAAGLYRAGSPEGFSTFMSHLLRRKTSRTPPNVVDPRTSPRSEVSRRARERCAESN